MVEIPPIYVLTDRIQGFPFLHIFANSCYYDDDDDGSHSGMCKVVSDCTFNLHFSDD